MKTQIKKENKIEIMDERHIMGINYVLLQLSNRNPYVKLDYSSLQSLFVKCILAHNVLFKTSIFSFFKHLIMRYGLARNIVYELYLSFIYSFNFLSLYCFVFNLN